MADDLDKELEELESGIEEDDSKGGGEKSKGKHSPGSELKATLKGALPYSLGGGLLGALGGYLFTGGSKSENQSDRSKRRLKNALIMGLMGAGVGGSGKILYDFATDKAPSAINDMDKAIAKAVRGVTEKAKDSVIVKLLSGSLGAITGQIPGGKIVNYGLNKNYDIIKNFMKKNVSGTPKSVVDAALAESKGDVSMAATNNKYFTRTKNPARLEVLNKSIKRVKNPTIKSIGGRTAGGILGAAGGYKLPEAADWFLSLFGESADENIANEE